MLQHRTIVSSARANVPLRAALESLPGYTQTLDGLARVRAFISAEADAGGAERPVDLVEEVVEAATSGSAEPADLAGRAYAASQVEPRNRARLHIFDEATQRLEIALDSIVSNGSDQLFTSLHEQLQNVVTAFGEIAPQVAGIASADAAIVADKAEAWRQFQDLGETYGAIRSGQTRLMQSFANGQRTGLHAHIANLDDVFEAWLPWLRAGGMVNPRTRQVTRLAPPWPDGGGVAFLQWAVSSGARLWVPAPGELSRYVQESTDASQERWYGKSTPLEHYTTREADDPGRLVPADAGLHPADAS